MTEKINGRGFGSIEPTGNDHGPSRAELSAPSAPSEAETRADSLSLTPSALLLQRPEEILVAAPPYNAKRIAALKQAIDSGTYEVDARTISDRLIGREQVRSQRSLLVWSGIATGAC